ncbi:type IV pilin protein [Xanthomonas sacchari]|uniref:Type IV pilin protein n=1 Tax=Xanthomonas sacchari TaxID=56458 RepID=A0A2P5Z9M0_9XANT|nr:type IV pilin protein [Xanthomonas sacchari]MDV0439437.1 type IV pilin protein [Xanthomonas sacchari]PPU85307.1 type IV pilin protein [Xanthomonas sacchari]
MRSLSFPARRQRGFTLIELMIVVAIVGVLAGIAFASYQSYVVKSRRSAASVCLQQGAQLIERYYTANMTYVGVNKPQCATDAVQFYTVDFTGTPTANAFKLTATPTGPQLAKDTQCGALSIDQKGARTTSTGAGEGTCW